MKRLFSLFLALAFCLSLTGCRSESQKALKAAMDEANGYTTVDYVMDDGTMLEQTVIYDKNKVLVTVLGITGNTADNELWIRVENQSNQEIHVNVNSETLNGWQVDGSVGFDVEKGKMEKNSLWLDTYTLENLQIPSVGSVTLTGEVYDNDYDQIGSFDAELKTSAYGQQTDDYDPSGLVLYDDHDIKLVYQGLFNQDYASYALFYVENNRTNDIWLENGDELTLADGSILNAYLNEQIFSGARKLIRMDLDPTEIYDESIYYDEEDYYTENWDEWDESDDWDEWDEDGYFDWSNYLPFTMDLTIEDAYSYTQIDSVEGLTFGEDELDTTGEADSDTPEASPDTSEPVPDQSEVPPSRSEADPANEAPPVSTEEDRSILSV